MQKSPQRLFCIFIIVRLLYLVRRWCPLILVLAVMLHCAIYYYALWARG
jgi:hypothetical protein